MNGIPATRTDKRLKPCPYCGNKNPTIKQIDLDLFAVGCSIYYIFASDEKSAINSWNSAVLKYKEDKK